MDWPSLAAAIGGPTLGAIAIVNSRREAREARAQAAELSEREHEHESELRRVERTYDDRKAAYLSILRWTLITMQRIQATEPIISFAGDPQAPDPPTEEEWRDLQISANAFGSREVDEALEDFIEKSRLFFLDSSTYRMIRNQSGTHDLAASGQRMQDAKIAAGEAYDVIRNLIRDELASM
jgi:hypothetical protein